MFLLLYVVGSHDYDHFQICLLLVYAFSHAQYELVFASLIAMNIRCMLTYPPRLIQLLSFTVLLLELLFHSPFVLALVKHRLRLH